MFEISSCGFLGDVSGISYCPFLARSMVYVIYVLYLYYPYLCFIFMVYVIYVLYLYSSCLCNNQRILTCSVSSLACSLPFSWTYIYFYFNFCLTLCHAQFRVGNVPCEPIEIAQLLTEAYMKAHAALQPNNTHAYIISFSDLPNDVQVRLIISHWLSGSYFYGFFWFQRMIFTYLARSWAIWPMCEVCACAGDFSHARYRWDITMTMIT